MGLIDTEGKKYLSDNRIFADCFNYLLYDGRQVIQAENLKELDTTQIAIPYGNGARVPTQKYRDLFKLWSARMDEDAVYLMLGAEIQGKQHMAIPIKNGLYDMIGYARQVEEAGKSYRKKKDEKSGDLVVEDETLKIKLTSEEFLSGFRKEDKLISIVSAVVNLSPEPWEGPLRLHDMLDVKNKEILKFVPDYAVNLIAPANIKDSDFKKFHTDFGLAMEILKYQKEKNISKIILSEEHKKVDRSTAVFLKNVANIGIEVTEKEKEMDLCLGMQLNYKEQQILGAIKAMRWMEAADDDILPKIMEKFDITKEYALELLSTKDDLLEKLSKEAA